MNATTTIFYRGCPCVPSIEFVANGSSGTRNITIDARVPRDEPKGTAKITYTANYTALACWDYTGDMRGNSWSLFWVKGRLSTNDMVAAIMRDFPRLWARITKPFGMATYGGDPEPAPANGVEHVAAREEPRQATSIDEVFPGLWESLVGTTIDLTQEAAAPSARERAKTA